MRQTQGWQDQACVSCQVDHVIKEQISLAGHTPQEFCGVLRQGETFLMFLLFSPLLSSHVISTGTGHSASDFVGKDLGKKPTLTRK